MKAAFRKFMVLAVAVGTLLLSGCFSPNMKNEPFPYKGVLKDPVTGKEITVLIYVEQQVPMERK